MMSFRTLLYLFKTDKKNKQTTPPLTKNYSGNGSVNNLYKSPMAVGPRRSSYLSVLFHDTIHTISFFKSLVTI